MKTRKPRVEFRRSGFTRINWKWRLYSANGRIIAHGTGFNTRASCKRSFETLKEILAGDYNEIDY